jgi:hypothetical protein
MTGQKRSFVSLAVTGLLLALPLSVSAGPERGQLLYENHCTSCHASTVHIREQRKVKSPAELRAFIQRWSGELKLTWSAEELNDVYLHLNNRYYKFPLATPAK